MKKNILCLVLASFLLSNCAHPNDQNAFITQTVGTQSQVTITPIPTPVPTFIPIVAPTETSVPIYRMIDAQNVSKLTLLHVWEVDKISLVGNGIAWFSSGRTFLMSVQRDSFWGVEAFNIENFDEGWFVETGPTAVTANQDEMFSYYGSLKKFNDKGMEDFAFSAPNCLDKSADFIIAVPDTSLLLTGHSVSEDQSDMEAQTHINMWDVDKRTCLGPLLKFSGRLSSLAVSHDANYLVYSASVYSKGSFETVTWLYDFKLKKVKCDFIGSISQFAQNGELIVYAPMSNIITRFALDSCEPLGKFSVDIDIAKLAIHPEGSLLVGGESSVALWDIHSGEKLKTFDFQDLRINFPILGFSPDGYFLITTTSRRSVNEKEKIMLWGILEN
jgi:WD40 repeat protein